MKVQISVFDGDLKAAAEKLSLPDKPEDISWADFLKDNTELLCSRGNSWCERRGISMRIISAEISHAVRDGDIIDNSVSAVVAAESVVPSEIAAALGLSGPLLSLAKLIPDDFSMGIISSAVNMNRGIISREGRKFLAAKGIMVSDISVNMVKEKAAV